MNEEQQAEDLWSHICREQGWNALSQLIILKTVIREQKLFSKVVEFASKAADEENGSD